MALEVTDENFEEGVLRRSEATVVILELSADRTSGAGRHLGGASDAEVLVTTLMEVAAPGIV